MEKVKTLKGKQMYICKYKSAYLYDLKDSSNTWYWIKNNGTILKVVNGYIDKKVSEEEIPDIVWLAIKIGAYKTSGYNEV